MYMRVFEKVTRSNFLSALNRLGLVLTHGQANALATEHRKDYARFIKLRERLNISEVGGTKRNTPRHTECMTYVCTNMEKMGD